MIRDPFRFYRVAPPAPTYGPVELPMVDVQSYLPGDFVANRVRQGGATFMRPVVGLMGQPQLDMVGMFTGVEQTPSEAMGISNPVAEFLINSALDPLNAVGVTSIGRAMMRNSMRNPFKAFDLRNAYKYNPLPGSPNVTSYYHGSPWRWEDDLFDESMIGKGEGATKRMRGLNLFPEEKLHVAPKFANIKSADAPIHIGSSNKIEQSLLDKLNPTVYKFDDIGNNLKLKEVSGMQIKNLKQEDLIKEGFDGIKTEGQITVFPSSVNKLSKASAQNIEEFVKANSNVKNWTKWTTNPKEFERITGLKLTAKELEELKEATKRLPGSPNAFKSEID